MAAEVSLVWSVLIAWSTAEEVGLSFVRLALETAVMGLCTLGACWIFRGRIIKQERPAHRHESAGWRAGLGGFAAVVIASQAPHIALLPVVVAAGGGLIAFVIVVGPALSDNWTDRLEAGDPS
jgi:hypothetical protein